MPSAACSRCKTACAKRDRHGARVRAAVQGARRRLAGGRRAVAGSGLSSRAAKVLALSCALAGCAHYPTNAPLERVDTDGGYRIRATAGDADDSTELAFVLTFSGGGTRAAAFAYGVLAALRDTEVEFDGRRRSLVGEIDAHFERLRRQRDRSLFRPPRHGHLRHVSGEIPVPKRSGRSSRVASWRRGTGYAWCRRLSAAATSWPSTSMSGSSTEKPTATSSARPRPRSSSTRPTSMRARSSRSIRISSTSCARTSRASRWHGPSPLRRPYPSRWRPSRWSTIRPGSADTSYRPGRPPTRRAAKCRRGAIKKRGGFDITCSTTIRASSTWWMVASRTTWGCALCTTRPRTPADS